MPAGCVARNSWEFGHAVAHFGGPQCKFFRDAARPRRASGIAVAQPQFFRLARHIKILRTIVLVAVLAPAWSRAGEFTRTLSTEELHRLGLDRLTPDQLAALNERIEHYKAGATAATTATGATPSTSPTPAPQGASASTNAPEIPTKAPEPRASKVLPDWVGALITLKRAENNTAKPQVLETRLVGKFSGWSGRTEFKLENGQVWTQANADAYRYTPPLDAPKVRIFPATFGSFWMEIEGVGQRCRVRPVRLE